MADVAPEFDSTMARDAALSAELASGEPVEAADEDAYLSEEQLRQVTGKADLNAVTFVELIADTSALSLSELGAKLPHLQELRLNSSVVPCLRDLGTQLKQLRVLWISRSLVSDLSGCAALPKLQELYASFNDVEDCGPLASCEELSSVDLESNRVQDLASVENLAFCSELHALNLDGNPIARLGRTWYRRSVAQAVPTLKTLDDEPVSDEERTQPPGAAQSQDAGDSAGAPSTSAGDEGGDELTKMRELMHAYNSELDLVSDGIKYARVGFDDPNAWDMFGALPSTASSASAPGTSHGAAAMRPRTAMVLPPRPGTAARLLAGGGGGASALRPTTSYGMGPLARSQAGSRPGTAFATTSAPPSGKGGRTLFWRKNDFESTTGTADETAESELTQGGEMTGGGAAALLRRKRAAQEEEVPAGADEDGGESAGVSLDHDALLTELRNWKLETSRLVLLDEEGPEELLRPPSPPVEGGSPSQAEVLTLGEGDEGTEEEEEEGEGEHAIPAPTHVLMGGAEASAPAEDLGDEGSPSCASDHPDAELRAVVASAELDASSFHVPLEFRGARPVGRLRPRDVRPPSREGA